jgi:hypothetical protein
MKILLPVQQKLLTSLLSTHVWTRSPIDKTIGRQITADAGKGIFPFPRALHLHEIEFVLGTTENLKL